MFDRRKFAAINSVDMNEHWKHCIDWREISENVYTQTIHTIEQAFRSKSNKFR